MKDIEELEIVIQNLNNAINNIVKAMNDLKDVDNVDEQYKALDIAEQELEDERMRLESILEELEEETVNEASKDQWEAERRELEQEYWNSQF